MKFKVGEKVKVKSNLEVGKRYDKDILFVNGMKQYKGKIVTIRKIYNDRYRIEEDEIDEWFWAEDMLEPLNAKLTKQELLNIPIGTKIITDATDKEYKELVFDGRDFQNKNHCLGFYEINNNLKITNRYYGTRIIKIEKPTYETIYEYQEEPKEMTVAEIEKALGHAVKIIKED